MGRAYGLDTVFEWAAEKSENEKPTDFRKMTVAELLKVQTQVQEEISRKLASEKKETENAALCVVCLDRKKDTLVQPCAHLVLCKTCADPEKVKKCPVCRAAVDRFQFVHL